ncbi:mycothione reductase [Corynebacterium kutscheri]|uniref:Mycothione reductase n=1 Tax=Corynebacterium kutscheri TaxID=35755 RepID=A0AB38VV71_9CORY|nr:NAD(P)/FAD-dependent oxidoreductase [Corynebacterium kutscheri]VEH06615.1 mycothione reductase [Corynebacterium kutscheri]VEH82544.1 mycothione reductase [Corynebacterium kutscheri]
MVERQYVGGTCINVACIPTKSLVASARWIRDARTDSLFGVSGTQDATINLSALRAHKEGIVGAMVDAHEKMFSAPGLDFIRGEAQFIADKTVEVATEDGNSRTITADRILVNLGSRPLLPPIDGLADSGAWTSEDILRLERIPETLTIIGGGYIGVEFAQIMADFGSKVTLIADTEHIFPREDADAAAEVAAGLKDSGVQILYSVRAEKVTGHVGEAADSVSVHLSDGTQVHSAALLVATGRVPNTDQVGLEAAGIDVDDRGMIIVDQYQRTSADGVWAAGDSADTPMFTHASWHDFRVIRAQFDDEDTQFRSTTGRNIPYAVFTAVELARIGLSEKEAVESGLAVRIAKIPANAIPRAKAMRVQHGLWKAIVDEHTDKILGVNLVGPQSGEVFAVIHFGFQMPEEKSP